MENLVLFKSKNGDVTKKNLIDALIEIEAQNCEYLFIHSEINFGMPNPELSKKELLGHILDCIKSLKVKNLLVPTFTFSFCNREEFDVQNTKSSMGTFAEFFRKQPDAIRSVDPLMSVAMIGEDYSVINDIGNISCGENCTFDLLHKKSNKALGGGYKGKTKFLFLGNRMSDCMTYTHYIEAIRNVPYRYPKEFKGYVINNGVKEEKTYYLHVRYKDIYPFNDTRIDKLMLDNNGGKVINLGNSVISIADEDKVYKYLNEAIDKDPDFMLSHKCPKPPFDDFYVYEKKVAL